MPNETDRRIADAMLLSMIVVLLFAVGGAASSLHAPRAHDDQRFAEMREP